MNQLTLDSAARCEAERDFQAAVMEWHRATTDEERAAIALELARSRGVLILNFEYSLEMLCQLLDAA